MSALLDHLYETMPSLPALVYFARKMNASEGVPDSKDNTIRAMLATLATVSTIDYEILEKTHLEYVREIMQKKEEEERAEEESEAKADRPMPEFLKEQAEHVHEQLGLINSLDQKLTKALKGLEARIEQVKESLGEGTNTVDTAQGFQSIDTGCDGSPFESLFKDQPLWEIRRPAEEGFGDLERIPLTRQIAAPASPQMQAKTLNL